MEGRLFRYGPAAANVAFMSGGRQHQRHVVLVGGLTDGLMSQYVVPLAARLEAQQWSLVQALLSSSHAGYGLASLDQDADELHALACHLKVEYGSQGLVICGHSTGCQDGVRYAQRYRTSPAAPSLQGIVLQAPVSDVEWLGTQESTPDRIAQAAALVREGRPDDVAFRLMDVDGAAMSARRWLSLACPGGDDDMFSASLSAEQLAGIYGPLAGLPCLLLLSGAEEYLAGSQEEYQAVGRRLAQAIGTSAQVQVVEGARHALNGREEEGAAAIAAFVASL